MFKLPTRQYAVQSNWNPSAWKNMLEKSFFYYAVCIHECKYLSEVLLWLPMLMLWSTAKSDQISFYSYKWRVVDIILIKMANIPHHSNFLNSHWLAFVSENSLCMLIFLSLYEMFSLTEMKFEGEQSVIVVSWCIASLSVWLGHGRGRGEGDSDPFAFYEYPTIQGCISIVMTCRQFCLWKMYCS